MANIHDFNGIFVQPNAWYFLIILKLNNSILGSHHLMTSLYLNNDQVIKNVHKLMAITKSYKFNLLSEAIIVHIEVLHRPQKRAIILVWALIKSPNLSKVKKALKRDGTFKRFICYRMRLRDGKE